MNERKKRLIVVLGMHRSGTSVIARGLQVMGVELGNRLMPPSEGNNPRGFWEDVDINDLNIEMLRSLKRDWHFVAPIQPAEVDTLCTNGYAQRAVQMLQQKVAGVNVFGFKDPRVAKLLTFWKRVFSQAGMNAEYIIVVRHPLSVCESLAKRDGFDFEKSYLLWLEHVIGSLAGTLGEKRVLVDYDHFMRMPEQELTRIAGELELPIHAEELKRFQLQFLDSELQHTVYRLEDLMRASTSPPLVQDVYSSLLEAVTGAQSLDTPPLRDKIAQWDQEFARMNPVLKFADKLGIKTLTLMAERNALNESRNALLRETAQLKQTLAGQEQTLQKLQAELSMIQESRLWRWTKPFRAWFGLFRQSK